MDVYLAVVVTVIGLPLLALHLVAVFRSVRCRDMPVLFGVAFAAFGLLTAATTLPILWTMALHPA